LAVNRQTFWSKFIFKKLFKASKFLYLSVTPMLSKAPIFFKEKMLQQLDYKTILTLHLLVSKGDFTEKFACVYASPLLKFSKCTVVHSRAL